MLIKYYVIPLVLCAILTPGVKILADKKGWVARPSKDRWHQKPTALFGGIAIFASFAAPLFFLSDFSFIRILFLDTLHLKDMVKQGTAVGGVIFIGASFLFFTGLVDDFMRLKPQTKLLAQIMAASLAVFFGFRLHWFTSLTLDTMVTLVWIIGITNAFNLLDNMDGLCTGIGIVASLFIAVLFFNSAPQVAMIALCLAGALSGFLIYNFNPASIFMGDCGSLIIGYTLSLLCLRFTDLSMTSNVAIYAVPILILMVPIFDTTLVTLIRLLSGRKASVGGRDHTSHRLVLMGFSEKAAVMFLYATASVAGVAAIFVSRTDSISTPIVIIPIVISIGLMGIYLAQIRVYSEKEFSLLKNKSYTPILIELTYKKQILLLALDLVLVAFAYYVSYRIRFAETFFSFYFEVFMNSLPAIIVCKFVAFFIAGVYRGLWRFMSSDDVFVYIKASMLGTAFSVIAVTFIYRFENFSKGVFAIDLFLTGIFLLGTRFSFRFFLDTMKRKTTAGENVLIYGAGTGGEILMREILNNQRLNLRPIGFIDDDPVKTGKKLQGFPILGTPDIISAAIEKHNIDEVLVSFKKEKGDGLEKVRRACREKEIFLKKFSISLEEIDLENKKI